MDSIVLSRLAALLLTFWLCYGWILLPKAWRSYQQARVYLVAGALLAAMMFLATSLAGKVLTLDTLLGAIALYVVVPRIFLEAGFASNKFPLRDYEHYARMTLRGQ